MRKAGFLGAFILSATILAAQDQKSTSAADTQPPTVSSASVIAPDADVAHLYVYRARRYVGSALAPTITVDGNPVARVGSGRRVNIRLALGTHTIGSDDKSSVVTIDAKSGGAYYIRVDEETGFWKGHGKLTMLMPEQGSAEYKLQKAIEPERKLNLRMIEDD
jgi:hypothetical protein